MLVNAPLAEGRHGTSESAFAKVRLREWERRDPIVTSGPNDLRHLDPAAHIIPI